MTIEGSMKLVDGDCTSSRHEVVDGVNIDTASRSCLKRDVAHMGLSAHLQLEDLIPNSALEALCCL